jgi:hypothetical protein
MMLIGLWLLATAASMLWKVSGGRRLLHRHQWWCMHAVCGLHTVCLFEGGCRCCKLGSLKG